MRKITFGKFFDTEGFQEVGESHWNEVERIDEPDVKLNVSTIKLRTLAPRMITSYLTPCSCKILEDEIAVVALKIVSHNWHVHS